MKEFHDIVVNFATKCMIVALSPEKKLRWQGLCENNV